MRIVSQACADTSPDGFYRRCVSAGFLNEPTFAKKLTGDAVLVLSS